MPLSNRHIRIGLIVEDRYSDAYRVITQKILPGQARGYPLRKNKTIPATRKLRAWIEQVKDKFDFVIVFVGLDTPMHHKDPEYFQKLKQICREEEAALLIVKVELESWLLADVNSIARWKNSNHSFPIYHDTTKSPQEPKNEIIRLVNVVDSRRGRRKIYSFNPQWTAEIAENMELTEAVLSRNHSLRCYYDLVIGCCNENGQEYFSTYPQQSHCDSQEIP